MADFTFLYPLWLLALLPLALLYPWLKGASNKSQLIAPHLANLLNHTQKNESKIPYYLLALAWLISVIALAGPSFSKQSIPSFNLEGARVLVMDMSRSMYAQDIAPSRLAQAKYKALDMLPNWKEGSTGLVTYAADGYLVSPLTQDANTLSNLIPSLSPQIMPVAGSNAAAGVKEAIKLLEQSNFVNGDIVIITDGISQDDADKVLENVKEKNYRISILAIGTSQGAPIPLPDGKLLTDNGQTIIVKLDLSPLAKITQATGGILQSWQPTNTDVAKISQFTEKPMSSKASANKNEIEERINQGFWLIFPLLLFALASFRKGVILFIPLVFFSTPETQAAFFENDNQVGFNQFQQGNFEQAAEDFSSPAWKGAAQYKAGDYKGAIESFSNLKDHTSRYNLGNAYAKAGDLQKALDTYESLLSENPDHKDAKNNAEIVKKALEQQKKQEQQQKQQDEQNKRKQQEKEKDKQQGNDQNKSSEEKGENNQKGEQNDAQENQGEDQSEGNDPQSSQQDAKESNKDKKDQNQQDADAQKEQDPQNQDQQNAQEAEQKNSENDNEAQGKQQESMAQMNQNALSESDPILKKLEQVNNDTEALIRAQLLLQAREKEKPTSQNSW